MTNSCPTTLQIVKTAHLVDQWPTSQGLMTVPGKVRDNGAEGGDLTVFLDAIARSVSKETVCVNRISLNVAICGGAM